jgi:hypothetical protein
MKLNFFKGMADWLPIYILMANPLKMFQGIIQYPVATVLGRIQHFLTNFPGDIKCFIGRYINASE